MISIPTAQYSNGWKHFDSRYWWRFPLRL